MTLYHNPTIVTTPNDDGIGSLRWCITNAPSGSIITFNRNIGKTIKLTSGDLAFPSDKKLTIDGLGVNVIYQRQIIVLWLPDEDLDASLGSI